MKHILRKAIAFSGLFMALTAPALAGNVNVLNAIDEAFNPGRVCGNGGGEIVSVEIEVENLAYEKSVSLFWKGGSAQWNVTEASYNHSIPNTNKEIWDVSTGCRFDNESVQFAVRYQVNGMEFWDNNGSSDYFVAVDNPLLLEQPVVVSKAYIGTGGGCYGQCGYFTGEVLLENIAYEKKVNVVYSVNGSEWRTLSARYKRSLENNTEIWDWGINTGSTNDTVHFAVQYLVDGQEYWDNNHGVDHIADAAGHGE